MTPELKELEERVTGAEMKLLALEQELFEQIARALGERGASASSDGPDRRVARRPRRSGRDRRITSLRQTPRR